MAFGAQAASVSGSVGYGSDYIFRGQSQTEGDSALSMGLELDAGKGIYAGVWASEVSYVGSDADRETDLYVGWAGSIGNDISLDVGYIDYAYSGDANLDDADGWALRTWWRPDETGTAVPSVSVGYDTLSFSDVSNGYREAAGYNVGLNWDDLFQASDTLGLAFGQPLKGSDHTTAGTNDVDAFLWEVYYSFKPNDSIEVVPAIFGGSDTVSDTSDDIFGAMLQTTFKF